MNKATWVTEMTRSRAEHKPKKKEGAMKTIAVGTIQNFKSSSFIVGFMIIWQMCATTQWKQDIPCALTHKGSLCVV